VGMDTALYRDNTRYTLVVVPAYKLYLVNG
jgi:hypothetical protein